jgi:copper transport protein
VGLLALLRRASPPAAASALSQFSDFGVLAVLGLMTAGVVFAVLQLQALGQLATSAYGRWIVVKSGLLLALLGLAACNRLWLLPALQRGDAAAAPQLRRTVGAEIVLMAAAIAAAGLLAHTPPPRGVTVEVAQGQYAARLEVAPARAGANTITVTLRDARGAPVDPAEVVLELENAAAGVEPILRPASRSAPGEYRLQGGELAFAGDWSIAIHARLGDFDKIVLRAPVTVRDGPR